MSKIDQISSIISIQTDNFVCKISQNSWIIASNFTVMIDIIYSFHFKLEEGISSTIPQI